MKEIPKNVLEKLKKILRSKESFEKMGSKAEAEAFAARAQELLAQYNLEMSSIDISDDNRPKVGREDLDPTLLNVKNQGKWLFDLFKTISRYNYCSVIYKDVTLADIYPEEYDDMKKAMDQANYGSDEYYQARWKFRERFFHRRGSFKKIETLIIVGEAHNVEMVKFIVNQLHERVKPMVKEAWKNYNRDWIGGWDQDPDGKGKENRGQFVRGFLEGFVQGIGTKLSIEKERMFKKSPQIQTMALTLTNKVEKYIEENIPTSSKKSRSGSGSSDGNTQGYQKGLATSINKGVNSNPLNHRLIS